MTARSKQQPPTDTSGDLVLDLAGAKAIMKARRLLAARGGELPPLDISMYKSMAYKALDYLEQQVGQFELYQAMFADQPFGQVLDAEHLSALPTPSIKDSP